MSDVVAARPRRLPLDLSAAAGAPRLLDDGVATSPRKPPLPPRRMRRVRSAASVPLGGGYSSAVGEPSPLRFGTTNTPVTPSTTAAAAPPDRAQPEGSGSLHCPGDAAVVPPSPAGGDAHGGGKRHALLRRLALRTLIYVLYDVSPAGEKEAMRVGRVLLECAVDEALPAPARHDMRAAAKCVEYLAPAALSTAVSGLLRRGGAGSGLCFDTAHRAARQALINRLFFRLGTRRYAAASALGLVCCFFHAGLLRDLARPARWATHFAPWQGAAAVARSALYAAAFATPLRGAGAALSAPGATGSRRRCNLRRLIFAVVLAQSVALRRLLRLLAAGSVR